MSIGGAYTLGAFPARLPYGYRHQKHWSFPNSDLWEEDGAGEVNNGMHIHWTVGFQLERL